MKHLLTCKKRITAYEMETRWTWHLISNKNRIKNHKSHFKKAKPVETPRDTSKLHLIAICNPIPYSMDEMTRIRDTPRSGKDQNCTRANQSIPFPSNHSSSYDMNRSSK